MISAALSDISAAIDLEPLYVDAYWQRHLVNVSLNRPQQAIDDLNLLLQLKQDHVSALKSRLVQCNTIQSYRGLQRRGSADSEALGEIGQSLAKFSRFFACNYGRPYDS